MRWNYNVFAIHKYMRLNGKINNINCLKKLNLQNSTILIGGMPYMTAYYVILKEQKQAS